MLEGAKRSPGGLGGTGVPRVPPMFFAPTGVPPVVFGYAAEPDVLVEQLRQDEAIAEADTILLTIPNQLGVAYNVHVMEAILTHVAPGLGWR